MEDLQNAGFLELDDGRKIMWGKLSILLYSLFSDFLLGHNQ